MKYVFGNGTVLVANGEHSIRIREIDKPMPIGKPVGRGECNVSDFATYLQFESTEGLDVLLRALLVVRARMVEKRETK